MKGKPKFKYEDVVDFEIDGIKLTGTVMIIDRYGTFFSETGEPSYDIMVEHSPHCNGEPCLYKHIEEEFVHASES